MSKAFATKDDLQQFVTKAEFQTLLDYLNEGAGKIGGLESSLGHLGTGIRSLEKIVTDGNGQPALLAQFAEIKAEIAGIRARLTTCISEIDTIQKEYQARLQSQLRSADVEMKADRRVRRQIVTSCVCAIVAAIVAIVVAIIRQRP